MTISCSLCAQRIIPREQSTTFPCQHSYHYQCLQIWREVNQRDTVPPVCVTCDQPLNRREISRNLPNSAVQMAYRVNLCFGLFLVAAGIVIYNKAYPISGGLCLLGGGLSIVMAKKFREAYMELERIRPEPLEEVLMDSRLEQAAENLRRLNNELARRLS